MTPGQIDLLTYIHYYPDLYDMFDRGQFEELYDKVPSSSRPTLTTIFTDVLKIDLLSKMSEVPSNAYERIKVERDLTIPSNITRVGDAAFRGCNSLTTVEFEYGCSYIGANAFEGCGNMVALYLPESLQGIGSMAFNMCFIHTLTIPDDVQVGVQAFCNNLNLVEVTIGGGLGFSRGEFCGCTNLVKVNMLGEITTISSCAFQHCKSLKSFTVPKGTQVIGDQAFEYCEKLEEITLNNELVRIGRDAFNGCKLLRTVKYDGTLDQFDNITIRTKFPKDVEIVCLRDSKDDDDDDDSTADREYDRSRR